MAETSTPTSTPLTAHGLSPKGDVHWNLDTDVLLDISIARNEGVLSAHGALVTETGERTGRSPCLLYTSPSPRDATLSRMPSSA